MKVRLSMPVATQPGTSRRAWLIVARATAGAMLMAITITACTGGSPSSAPSIFTPQAPPQGSSTQTGSSVRTPSVGGSTPTGNASAHASTTPRATATHTATPKDSPTAKATSTPRATATTPRATASTPRATASTPRATHKATPTAKATQRPHASHAATPVPSATFFPGAPETGGGGTAGLQDGLLFGIGGAAVLAGLGSLVLRRRLARKHRPRRGTPADTDTPTHTSVR
jgi:hypothetical protein